MVGKASDDSHTTTSHVGDLLLHAMDGNRGSEEPLGVSSPDLCDCRHLSPQFLNTDPAPY